MFENIFAGFNIDTNDPELTDSFAEIPEGYYPAVVESIEQGFDKSGGIRFSAKVRLRECQFAGRVIFENYNLGSQNPQAVEIGKKQLAALARACGVNGTLTSPQQVVNIPVYAKIDPPKNNSKYNSIGAWLTVEAGQRLAATRNKASAPTPGAGVAPAFVPPAAPQPVASAFAAPAQPAIPAFVAPAQPQPAAPAFVAPQPAAQPAFVPPAQPQPVAQPVVQPVPMQAAPQPASFPAQPTTQPAAAAPAHKMPWE